MLLGAAQQIKELEKEFRTTKAADNDIHLEKYTTAMTHIDSMVVKMKVALECLKKYLAYYQVGATQTQTFMKTDHAKVGDTVAHAVLWLESVHEYNRC